jgi:UDP-N-acetylglucosamine 1-carboxyvinyltransferase
MTTLVIEGGTRLQGRVSVDGNKNAALPLLAACLLTEDECVLENAPRIRDVAVMAELLQSLGAEVEGIGGSTLRIRCRAVTSDEPDPALVGRLRGSVLLLGPLLARRGRACLAEPGGDFPSRRSIGVHLQALLAMGARRVPGEALVLEAPDGLRGGSFYLDEASVTGTETGLLAAAAARGRSEIRHAACEPHVVELCRFLSQMGASVEGSGSPSLRVEGAERLRGARQRLSGDYVEAGSWAVVAAITGGEVEIEGARAQDIEVVAAALRRLGVVCEVEDERFRVLASRLRAAGRVTTGVWPGFPTDMVCLITVVATQAEGTTLVHDCMYELRLFALEQLSGMGADLFLCDPHRIIVEGPRRLRARTLDSRDIRSGMAVIAAALVAEGRSEVAPLETVERGYARLVERLQALGARVWRREEGKGAS